MGRQSVPKRGRNKNMDRNVKTESRETGRGEQTNGRAMTADRQAMTAEVGRASFEALLGDKKMNRTNTNKIDEKIVRADNVRPDDELSNVLEFSAKLRELKKQVDP